MVSFDISFHFHVAHDFASHVDDWISFAVTMEAEGIKFHILFWPSLYTFPCHLLPHIGGGSHLKFLCLKVCKLRPPLELANRFSSLKSLELDHISLEESHMDVILSGCINLESLVLRIKLLPPFVTSPRKSSCPQVEVAGCVGWLLQYTEHWA